MRISDWSSDVCSSDLLDVNGYISGVVTNNNGSSADFVILADKFRLISPGNTAFAPFQVIDGITYIKKAAIQRSEEHTSELQSLMRISYAVFCLKKKK